VGMHLNTSNYVIDSDGDGSLLDIYNGGIGSYLLFDEWVNDTGIDKLVRINLILNGLVDDTSEAITIRVAWGIGYGIDIDPSMDYLVESIISETFPKTGSTISYATDRSWWIPDNGRINVIAYSTDTGDTAVGGLLYIIDDQGGMSLTTDGKVHAEDVDKIGGAIPITTTEIQASADAALVENDLDKLTKNPVNFERSVDLDSVIGHLADNGDPSYSFDRTTDSLESIRDNQTSSTTLTDGDLDDIQDRILDDRIPFLGQSIADILADTSTSSSPPRLGD
jgi:hypothetical protein